MPGRPDPAQTALRHRDSRSCRGNDAWALTKLVAAGLAVALFAAGCSQIPATINAQSGRVWEHRCPPAGTVVRTSDGATMSYGGSSEPGICRRADGRTTLYTLWLLPAGGRNNEVQDWLGRLFPASAGRTSTMNVIGSAIRSHDTFMFMREARVLGFETLAFSGYRGDTVVIEWQEFGTGNNVHRTRHRRWLDVETGALVRSEARVISGLGDEHAWHAVSISTGAIATPPLATLGSLGKPPSAPDTSRGNSRR